MGAEVGKSIASGKFEDREDRHFTYLPADVDEQGWTESIELLDETLDRFYGIIDAARKRRAESGDPAIPISMLGFERAPS